MKKRIIWIPLGIAAFLGIAWTMGGRTTIDYGLTCTKCLEDHFVVERKLLGITYSKERKLQSQPGGYREVMGQECEHVFHRGGLGESKYFLGGWSIGCGTTAEGIFFRQRNQAIRRTFEMASSLQEHECARRTIKLVDSLFPPDVDWKASRRSMDEPRDKLILLDMTLEKISTVGSWKAVLSGLENGTLADFEREYAMQPDER